MRGPVRVLGAVAVAALGAGTAAIAASGDGDVRACMAKRSGELRAATAAGRCGRAEIAITISGRAFKRNSRGGTLTINGIPFQRSRSGNVLTINGTAFRGSARGKTLTINGTSFRTGTLPNTLTINGVAMQAGAGGTLTINGTAFGPGVARGERGPAGADGATGERGPTGPAGTIAAAGPVAVAGPVALEAGADPSVLAAIEFSGSGPRRLLLSGGFDVVCDPCAQRVSSAWTLRLAGGADLARRNLQVLDAGDSTGAVVSEVVVTPGICGPCTIELAGSAVSGSGAVSTLQATAIRLALVDLGPA